jgi:hypothetical protein
MLAGVGAMILMIPINGLIARLMKTLQKKQMKNKVCVIKFGLIFSLVTSFGASHFWEAQLQPFSPRWGREQHCCKSKIQSQERD